MREFASIEEFVRFLQTRRSVILAEQKHGAQEAGEMLVHEAQDMIGEYQKGAGPFPAWAELSEATLYGGVSPEGHRFAGKYELGYAPPDNPLLRTGHMRGSIECSTSEHEVVIGSHDPIAVDQEYGTLNMPARPFIGPAMFRYGHDAARTIFSFVIAALAGSRRPVPKHHGHSEGD